MSAKRRQTAHDAKRRLLAKLEPLPDERVREILSEIRDYVIARRFLAGHSLPRIVSDEALNWREWDERRVEVAIRSHAKATKGRQR